MHKDYMKMKTIFCLKYKKQKCMEFLFKIDASLLERAFLRNVQKCRFFQQYY